MLTPAHGNIQQGDGSLVFYTHQTLLKLIGLDSRFVLLRQEGEDEEDRLNPDIYARASQDTSRFSASLELANNFYFGAENTRLQTVIEGSYLIASGESLDSPFRVAAVTSDIRDIGYGRSALSASVLGKSDNNALLAAAVHYFSMTGNYYVTCVEQIVSAEDYLKISDSEKMDLCGVESKWKQSPGLHNLSFSQRFQKNVLPSTTLHLMFTSELETAPKKEFFANLAKRFPMAVYGDEQFTLTGDVVHGVLPRVVFSTKDQEIIDRLREIKLALRKYV